jgi:hypothetical protein
MNNETVKCICYICCDYIGEINWSFISGPIDYNIETSVDNDIMKRELFFMFHPKSGVLYNYTHPINILETNIKYFQEKYNNNDDIETVSNWVICEKCNLLCINENTFDKTKCVITIRELEDTIREKNETIVEFKNNIIIKESIIKRLEKISTKSRLLLGVILSMLIILFVLFIIISLFALKN